MILRAPELRVLLFFLRDMYMNMFRCLVLDPKYNYCEIVEIDMDEYFIEFPVPHSLVPEYYDKFIEILGELEKRTAQGV